MKRYSLARLRSIMQQHSHYSRNFGQPSVFNPSRQNPRFSSTSWSQSHGDSSAPSSQNEAWTQYDGLGPVQQGGPRNLGGNWRSGQIAGAGSSRGGRSNGFGHPGPSSGPKKSRQMPPASRPRQAGGKGGSKTQPPVNRELIDEAYLERTYGSIPKEDYPRAPNTLFTNPKGFLWDNKDLSAKSSFATQRGGIFRSTVFVHLPDGGRVEAVGEAVGKKLAEKIACQHMLLKLHQLGKLNEVLTSGLHSSIHNTELIAQEQDAKLDVYDYCARYGTMPTFTPREFKYANRKAAVEVTVEMPEKGIKAVARATERRTAEILACVEFKRQAEAFHAEHGDEDIVVKDMTVLNSRNARKFFEFFKTIERRADFKVITEPARGPKKLAASMMQGQVYLNNEPIGIPVEMNNKKLAESAAYLTGALALKAEYPELFPEFVEALRIGNGDILKPVNPSWVELDQDCLIAMTDTMVEIGRIGLPRIDETPAEVETQQQRRAPPQRRLDPLLAAVKSKKMQKAYEDYLADEKLATLRKKREDLPMNQYTARVLDLINENEVSIIVGATGSGKTTQVPQIVLEQATKDGTGADCNVICTQPRRIAATSVAQRVAVERNEPLQKSVGYQVRFDSKPPIAGGSITYCTTGVLLQQLRHAPDETLDGITHLIIDEVHERDVLIDYLLIILKRTLKERKKSGKSPVKVVLMSATMDTQLFASYFRQKKPDGSYVECPSLSVPGRTFPVKEFFLEEIMDMLQASHPPQSLQLNDLDTRKYLALEKDVVPVSRVPSAAPSAKDDTDYEADNDNAVINWKQELAISADGQASMNNEKDDKLIPLNLIATTLAHIASTTEDGAILVFLPGLEEIEALDEMLQRTPLGVDFRNTAKFKISWLHSSIPNQNEVFEDVAEGCRKVILSTNIAETSVTIPDVKYVVDSGKMREIQYEQSRRITQLVCTWISKSNAKQRAGRAGRVQDGNYYAMYSRPRHESMRASGLPEILRSDLQEICLNIKAQGFGDPTQFLSEAIEPPAPSAIEACLRQLRALEAIDENENLTQLGNVLATIPVEPALGKMIILAIIFRCLDPIIILGAAQGNRDLFVRPPTARQEADRARHRFVGGDQSDHMATINAFRAWRNVRERDGQFAAQRFAENNFLHKGALRVLDQTANQIHEILGNIGLVPKGSSRSQFGHPRLNDNSDDQTIIKALTLAGMYPNLAVNTGGRGYRTVSENFSMVHPSSVLYSASKNNEDLPPIGSLLTFSAKAKGQDGSVYLRQNTLSTPLQALLFGGRMRPVGNTLVIDTWLPFLIKERNSKIMIEFRKIVNRILAHAFQNLSHRKSESAGFLADDPAREALARGMVEVLNREVRPRSRWGSRAPSRERNGFGSRESSTNRAFDFRNGARAGGGWRF